jgi:hypothetical protein
MKLDNSIFWVGRKMNTMQIRAEAICEASRLGLSVDEMSEIVPFVQTSHGLLSRFVDDDAILAKSVREAVRDLVFLMRRNDALRIH